MKGAGAFQGDLIAVVATGSELAAVAAVQSGLAFREHHREPVERCFALDHSPGRQLEALGFAIQRTAVLITQILAGSQTIASLLLQRMADRRPHPRLEFVVDDIGCIRRRRTNR